MSVVINGTTGINTIQDNTVTSAKIVDSSILVGDMDNSATSIGVGQTWQNVTSSRALGVTYTNTTGKPIAITIYGRVETTSQNIMLYVDGNVVAYGGSSDGVNWLYVQVSAIIPKNSTYSYGHNGVIIDIYGIKELR